MIMVLLNWLYIAVTSFLTGYALLSFFSSLFGIKNNKILPSVLAGLVINTVYAQFYSLVSGVGIVANIVLAIVSIVVFVIYRQAIKEIVQSWLKRLVEQKGYAVAYVCTVLLMAYGTSRGFIHFDTSLYHAQSIRWIEEYGVVPGLAVLQLRYGYNSSAFALTALYSMRDVFGQSLHTTAGFFALIGAISALDVYKVFTESRVRYSDFIRIGLIFYIGLIYTEMISPASDYYAQILIFMTLIMWLDADELKEYADEAEAYPYAAISILLVYAATIKFSIALLVLLCIKPAIILIRRKQVKQITASLISGIMVLLPFFIRNIIISGWMIYPSTIIDISKVDWKIPKGVAQYDAAEIGVYGKGINDVALKNTPMSVWIPSWFRAMTMIEKFWVCLTALSIIVGIGYFIYTFCKKRADWNKILIFAVVVAGGVFWFISAPLVRYGYGYLTCIPFMVDGMLCYELVKKTGDKKSLKIAYIIVLAVICAYRVKTVGYHIITTLNQPYYYAQKEYTDWQASERKIGDYTFYVPEEADQIGYDKFPSSSFIFDIELRGNEITDGFRIKNYDQFIAGWQEENNE